MIYIIEGAVALVAAILAFVLGVAYRRRTAEAAIGSAEEEATRILNDAMKNAEAKKKQRGEEGHELLRHPTAEDRANRYGERMHDQNADGHASQYPFPVVFCRKGHDDELRLVPHLG